jgi:ribonuclease P protein component
VLRNDKQHGQYGRAAFVAGKKLGNAVWRNKAKRRLRSICRELGGPLDGYDMIFLAKKSTNTVSYGVLLDNARKAMNELER